MEYDSADSYLDDCRCNLVDSVMLDAWIRVDSTLSVLIDWKAKRLRSVRSLSQSYSIQELFPSREKGISVSIVSGISRGYMTPVNRRNV